MKTKYTHFLIALLLLISLSCEETTIIKNYTGTGEEKTYSIEGYAQKGPFIVGSNVTVAELNDELIPTGRVFFATILNDDGYFELPGVVLSSPYVQIKVEGLYFSEVSGGVPIPGDLTLYSLADIRETQNINVNILTHLEKERVEYLVQEEQKSFSDSKSQALEELLQIFNWEDFNIQNAEELSITTDSDGGAVLLSASSIIENYGTFEQRLELITNFQIDFTDGVLDSEDIQNKLFNSAYVLNIDYVIQNLTNEFPNKNIPDIEPIIDHFLTHSEYKNYFDNIFPTMTGNNINLLENQSVESLDPAKTYWISINPPDEDVDMFLYIELRVTHTFIESNSFDASSIQWTSIENGNCQLPFNEACYNSKRYVLEMTKEDKTSVQIPITFSGHGEHMQLWFVLGVDGFRFPRSFETERNLNW